MLPVLATKNSQRVIPTLADKRSLSSDLNDTPPLSSMVLISGSIQKTFSHLFSLIKSERIFGKSCFVSQKIKLPFNELKILANNSSSDSSSDLAYISASDSAAE